MARLCREGSGPYSGRSLREQPRATEEDLRATPKGVETPPIPTAPRMARPSATSGVAEQKSAKVIVPGGARKAESGKDRTGKNKEESCPTRNRR